MNEFWILIFVAFFATLEKAEAVKLDENPYKIFDEIFGEEWWDNDKAEEWHKLTLEQNFHEIDRQNTQLGQIEPNSTDQLGQIEPNSTDQNPPLAESDHSGQIEPNSTDQNPPLAESDHSAKTKNGEEISSNENIDEDERKRKIINKFHAMRNEFKQKGKYSKKERVQIEHKIAKHLKVNRTKIFEWKKEFGLCRINTKNKRENLVEKFDQMKAELKRDGFKNSYKNEIDKIVAKELGLSDRTIFNWKSELGQTNPHHNHNKQKELMKRYYEIKDKKPKMSDESIVKMLKISRATLCTWKSQFKRQQFHPNSVDGLSVEENAAANVRGINNPNLESIE